MMSKYTLLVAATAFFGASNVAAFSAANDGCYTSTTGLTLNGTDTFNSAGYCSTQCLALGMPVMATKDSSCYCGATLPPASDSTDNSTCSFTCPGYPSDLCGGSSVYSVYLTGLTYKVTNYGSSTTTSATAAKPTGGATTGTTSASPSVVTIGGQTVVVTASSSSTGTSSADKNSSSGPSKAGIAAGVVIGVIAIAAMAGGLFIFLRNRKRREVEEEYRRNAAVSSFIAGGKPPHSSGGGSFNDMRLDPSVMAQRRMSDGSIADNQDYSRRILKVTNA